jgi:hypothetical protein
MQEISGHNVQALLDALNDARASIGPASRARRKPACFDLLRSGEGVKVVVEP